MDAGHYPWGGLIFNGDPHSVNPKRSIKLHKGIRADTHALTFYNGSPTIHDNFDNRFIMV